ncbi:hypothetical protein D5018_15530 [Parashewanella curva]|uniref:Death domain-containing protein n=1 Tax=Parashewanella curva TaxID=2338552 RepID=A0A3L8PTX5_9GAMM|nr:death domain-containing protein [Parashewanella curva]RLV58756.1 hypothetical protein D5018_15530 [Parashewanella curva]
MATFNPDSYTAHAGRYSPPPAYSATEPHATAQPRLSVNALDKHLDSVTDWHKLGLKLDISMSQLSNISVTHHYRGVGYCRQQMLNLWVTKSTARVDILLSALKEMGEISLAVNLKRHYDSNSKFLESETAIGNRIWDNVRQIERKNMPSFHQYMGGTQPSRAQTTEYQVRAAQPISYVKPQAQVQNTYQMNTELHNVLLKDCLKAMEDIGPYWETIAVHVGLNRSEIDVIKMENKFYISSKVIALITKIQKRYIHTTVGDLYTAVKVSCGPDQANAMLSRLGVATVREEAEEGRGQTGNSSCVIS